MAASINFHGDLLSVYANDLGNCATLKMEIKNDVYGKGESLPNELAVFFDDIELAKRLAVAMTAVIDERRAELAEAEIIQEAAE